jgi:hypothetical protein
LTAHHGRVGSPLEPSGHKRDGVVCCFGAIYVESLAFWDFWRLGFCLGLDRRYPTLLPRSLSWTTRVIYLRPCAASQFIKILNNTTLLLIPAPMDEPVTVSRSSA